MSSKELLHLNLHSEKYSATGNLASEGVSNQLGRPKLDQLTVLMRESVQNSWDAKLPENASMSYDLELRCITPEQREIFENIIFREPPRNLEIRTALQEKQSLPVLTLSDRGTSGLGGWTRADRLTEKGDDTPQDFVDFLRNIGQPPDKQLGGGTFGYGKAALYQVSHHRTILVYTRCLHDGKLQTRFMVAALGPGFEVRDDSSQRGRYTGRHWLGRWDGDIVEPLLNEEADRLASAIGMPGFKGKERGTSIMIFDFIPGDGRTLSDAMDVMFEALLWNLWPKMVPESGGEPPIVFSASLNGEKLSIPLLENIYPLGFFARALEDLRLKARGRKPEGYSELFNITRGNQRKHMGWLSLIRTSRPKGGVSSITEAATGRPQNLEQVHHVALMRNAELVVRYESGPPALSSLYEYVGVFVSAAEHEVDRAFAASEPPTHDDWIIENLQNTLQKSYIRVSLRKITEKMHELVTPTKQEAAGGDAAPLGRISRFMGEILMGLPGPGANSKPSRVVRPSGPTMNEDGEPEASEGAESADGVGELSNEDADNTPSKINSRPKKPGKPRVTPSAPELKVVDGVPILMMKVQVRHGVRTAGTRLKVHTSVVLDGNQSENAPPEGAEIPSVYFWRRPDGTRIHADGNEIEIPLEQPGSWRVGVRLIDEAEVKIAVHGEALPGK